MLGIVRGFAEEWRGGGGQLCLEYLLHAGTTFVVTLVSEGLESLSVANRLEEQESRNMVSLTPSRALSRSVG